MVWVLPFVGASLMPAIAKAGNRVRNYAAVGFALASAISAVTLLPLGIDTEVMFIVRLTGYRF